MSKIRTAVLGVGLILLSGCTSYYKVTDPSTSRTYYTKDLQDKRGGAVSFTDGNTGDDITIQNSQTQKIDEQQYEEGLRVEAAKQAQKSQTGTSSSTGMK